LTRLPFSQSAAVAGAADGLVRASMD